MLSGMPDVRMQSSVDTYSQSGSCSNPASCWMQARPLMYGQKNHPSPGGSMHVDVIETPDLGDRSYVVSDGTCAVVVDPQRDLDRVESLLETLGVPVTLVVETP